MQALEFPVNRHVSPHSVVVFLGGKNKSLRKMHNISPSYGKSSVMYFRLSQFIPCLNIYPQCVLCLVGSLGEKDRFMLK